MRASADPKQRIKRMSRRIKDLHSRAQELERQHRTLAIQHHVMMCCCELLDWMRSSPDMHPGWMAYKEGLLPEELPLLEQLGATPLSTQGSSQPGHQQQQQAGQPRPQHQPQHQHQHQHQHQQQQVFMQAPMPAQCRTASCSSATGGGPGGTAGGLTGSAASAVQAPAASSAGSCQPQQQQQQPAGRAAATATAEGGVPGEPDPGLSLQEVFDGAQNWELDRHPSSTDSAAGPSAACNNIDTSHAAAPAGVRVKLEAAAAVSTPAPAQAPSQGLHAATGTMGPVPPSAQAQAPSPEAAAAPGQPVDRSMLWIAAPGDFLGPMRDAFSQPPLPGADSMSVQQLGERHCSLVDVNRRMMDALERIKAGEQHSPHPVSVMREKLVTHVSLIATVMLLHPDDLLNKIRVLNHSTMQLEDCADRADKAWQRMWDVVDDLGFTEQQQYLISIGCGVFKRLISGVMQQRQALAARQQELLQVNSNGRSVDLQEQQACAERLHVAVRKERFLSQCWGTYVTSICSVTQIARLSIKYFPYSPQIAVMGAVLSRKLEEAQEQQARERERRRRRTHGLVISPAILAGQATSSG